MDEEGIIDEVTFEPRLHDRWSLLTLAVAFTGDLVQITADYFASAAMMAAQHSKQKEYDRKFKEIIK
jgi:hypothetical protein